MQTFGTVFSQRVLSVLEKHRNDEITIEVAKEFLFDMLESTVRMIHISFKCIV